MQDSRLIFTDSAADELRALLSDHNGVAVVVTDSTVSRLVIPRLSLDGLPVIEMEAGEEHKTLETVARIWQAFISHEVTRRSLVINVGGGVVTDTGGFASATFKRGVRFVNVPTTLLCAVDAAVGGKTGIDFGGLKNEIGAFAPAEAVVFDSSLFTTLPREQMLSGLGEMVKHAMLSGPGQYAAMLSLDIDNVSHRELNRLLCDNVAVKQAIVKSDPLEAGPRKALNLGHTAGHAIESLMLSHGRNIAHGIAVANGLLVTLILSGMNLGFPSAEISRYASWLRDSGMTAGIQFSCDDYEQMLWLMRHDKKNTTSAADTVSFTLLRDFGHPVTDTATTTSDIKISLDIYRDLIGI